MKLFRLKLFIVGQTLKSSQAITNIQMICEAHLKDQYQLDIVDLLERPQLAEDERILATPTLIRYSPSPVRRIIGDLSDTAQILNVLGILVDND